MEINGKLVPVYEPYGPEWEKEMMELGKRTIIKMLKTKGMAELRGEGVPDTGLRVTRYTLDKTGYVKDTKGVFVRYKDYEKIHESLQALIGKNLNLSTQIAHGGKS